MHSLNIIHVLRAPLGGLFRHVVDLVGGQAARGHRVGMIVDSLTGNARADETIAALKPSLALGVSTVPMPRSLSLLDFTAALHVMRRVRDTAADVVHGHGAKGGAYARLAMTGKPVARAYTPHGGSLLLDHATLTGKAYLALEKILRPRADLFLFESAYGANVFRAKVGEAGERAHVIHNGVRAAEFEPVPLAADATDIVFVGEFRPVKGIDTLIDAIGLLRREGPALTATLIGSGPEAEALKAQVDALGLAGAVRFKPAMPMRQALTHGRLVVLPSRAESLPYVVLEAAAAERPMITTRVGGIPEIYGPLSDTLVAPGDAQALADAIKGAIENPANAAERARTLRARIAALFTLDVMVDSVLGCYEQVLSVAPLIGHVVGA